jgi:protein-S-isoprenylcysteine O-methyltransferase Ste14
MAGRGEPKDDSTTSWRWDNVPLPEPHMAGVLFSAALLSLPLVGGIIHREVLEEERALEGAFGEEYVRYRRLVSRYV